MKKSETWCILIFIFLNLIVISSINCSNDNVETEASDKTVPKNPEEFAAFCKTKLKTIYQNLISQ
jgi:hypothetical protein